MTSLFPHLPAVRARMTDEQITAVAKELECFETDPWAAEAILRHEILTPAVWDPCCGTGVLSEAAQQAGCAVIATDIFDWSYEPALDGNRDFLAALHSPFDPGIEFSVFMNPPFSLACEFVDKAFELGARKVVCFQRFPWFSSRERREFWERRRAARAYVCGDRATCWRFDIPLEERGVDTPTTHAWYVWEQGHPSGPLMGHVWRDG